MRDQRGFSLTELLVALLILTLVITLSITGFVERKRRLQQASEIILAYQALANEAEYRRGIAFRDLDTSPVKFTTTSELLDPLKPYETEVRVEDTGTGVKNVTMTIHWQNRKREATLALVRVDTGGTNLW